MALGLNQLGVAIAASDTDLSLALSTLQECFDIRNRLLGPNHVDTVDTLSNMADVRCSLKEYEAAYNTYLAVLRSREWLFGRIHLSVAATALSIANVLELIHGEDSIESQEYYAVVIEIYQIFRMPCPPEVVAKFPELAVQVKEDTTGDAAEQDEPPQVVVVVGSEDEGTDDTQEETVDDTQEEIADGGHEEATDGIEEEGMIKEVIQEEEQSEAVVPNKVEDISEETADEKVVLDDHFNDVVSNKHEVYVDSDTDSSTCVFQDCRSIEIGVRLEI